jgi:hypothetical protein
LAGSLKYVMYFYIWSNSIILEQEAYH